MGYQVIQYDHDIKRLRTYVDQTVGIQWYTRNNLYPQLVEAIRDRSLTAKPACERTADFIRGDGFEDQSLAGLVVNSKGSTANDMLKAISVDASTFSGAFVIHLGVNMLGQYNNISVWPLRFWRFGLPDENEDVFDYKFNYNWEQDPYKMVNKAIRIEEYPKFNPNPELIKDQIGEWGMSYPGQVMYATTIDDEYNLCTFDSVLDQSQTQEEIGIFRLKSIQNGLNASAIVSYPGKFEDDQKAQQFKDGLDPFKGGKGAGSIIVIEDEGGLRKAQDLITPLTIQNNDKIHELISKDSKDEIRGAFKMPMGILGAHPDGGIFNKQELEDEYYYFNNVTRNFRTDISSALKKVFANWYQPVTDNFNIKELSYIKNAQVG